MANRKRVKKKMFKKKNKKNDFLKFLSNYC